MAEIVIPVGYGNAVLVWQTSTRTPPITCTFGYETGGTGVSATANAEAIFAAITSVSGNPAPAAPARMTTAWQFTRVTTYERRVPGALTRGDSAAAPSVGTIVSGGNEMVVSAPLRITKRTAFVGRKYRGRFYAPYTGLESDISAAGLVTATPLSQAQLSWNKFLGNLQAFPFVPVLLHSDPAQAPTPIASFFVQSVVGTQRRRLSR